MHNSHAASFWLWNPASRGIGSAGMQAGSSASWAAILMATFATYPLTAIAGPIYGTIRDASGPVRAAKVDISCPNSPPVIAQTDNFGSFKLNVATQGRCLLRVNNGQPTAIYSSSNAIRYDFSIAQGPHGPQLVRQ